MEDHAVLFKLRSLGDKERSLAGTSAAVELPTLNAEVQGVNTVLNGFSLNDTCSEIFPPPSLPPYVLSTDPTQRPHSQSLYSVHFLQGTWHFIFFSHCSRRAELTLNLFTTIFPTSDICLAHSRPAENSYLIN